MSHGKGHTLSQEGHIINALAPIDIGGTKTSAEFSMENWAHATIICVMGVVTNDTTITVEECTTAAGGSNDAIDFKYAQELTADGDTLAALAWVGGVGGITTGTENNTIHVIEIDASQLSAGHYWVRVVAAAAAALYSCVVVLTGGRHQSGITATAIV